MKTSDNKIKELGTNIEKLESELKDEKNKNNILLTENKQLKQENSQLRIKINLFVNQEKIKNDLLKEIKQLKQQTIESHNQMFNSINKIENLSNNLQDNQNNSNDSIVKLIQDKEIEINDLKEKLQRFPFILEKNEKLISIICSSIDEKIYYSVICKNTDNIVKLEEELYKEYPNLFGNKYYIFLWKGKIINRFQTLESNNIKNGDTIILKFNEKIEDKN